MGCVLLAFILDFDKFEIWMRFVNERIWGFVMVALALCSWLWFNREWHLGRFGSEIGIGLDRLDGI